jgi:hypothetical protein
MMTVMSQGFGEMFPQESVSPSLEVALSFK